MGHGSAYVIFRLGDEEYGLPVTSVSGIVRYEPSTPVPRTHESVMGVLNLRGRVIPVVDLKMRFSGMRFEPAAMSRIVVAEGKAGPVGIAVDFASEVAEIDVDAVKPVPDSVLSVETSRAFTGVVERNGALLILLDLDEAVPRADYQGALTSADVEDSDV